MGGCWVHVLVRSSQEIEVAPGLRCRFPDLATFMATKFEAFGDRGGGDYWGDADFEDVYKRQGYTHAAGKAVVLSNNPGIIDHPNWTLGQILSLKLWP